MNRHSSALARMAMWASVFITPVLSPAASVIYSNFGAGSSYDTSQGNLVGNGFDGNNYAQGDTFTAGANFLFSSVRIALSCVGSCTDAFSVTLSRDAGNQPGTALESFTVFAGALGTLGANNLPITLNSALTPALTAGTQYWITVSADLNDSIDWNLNAGGDSGAEAISVDGGSSWFSPSGNTPGAFEVDGVSPIVNGIAPEPRSIALVLSAGLVFGYLGNRHRLRLRALHTREGNGQD